MHTQRSGRYAGGMQRAPKLCPNCEKPLVQRPNERDEAFDGRTYCGRLCHRQALRTGKQRLHAMRMTGNPGFW